MRKFVKRHEAGEIEVFIHPNCLAEAFKVISVLQQEKLVSSDVNPASIVRSAYATLTVLQNETITNHLGSLRLKYRNKPWGDLSSAAVALSLSDESKKSAVPVIILDHEVHFKDIDGVDTLRVSQLN